MVLRQQRYLPHAGRSARGCWPLPPRLESVWRCPKAEMATPQVRPSDAAKARCLWHRPDRASMSRQAATRNPEPPRAEGPVRRSAPRRRASEPPARLPAAAAMPALQTSRARHPRSRRERANLRRSAPAIRRRHRRARQTPSRSRKIRSRYGATCRSGRHVGADDRKAAAMCDRGPWEPSGKTARTHNAGHRVLFGSPWLCSAAFGSRRVPSAFRPCHPLAQARALRHDGRMARRKTCRR